MNKLFSFLAIAGLVIGSGLSVVPARAAAVPLSDVDSGDLVRGESFSAVYYVGEDGFRYVFPNDKTYFTWYENFDGVKWISDADLASIQIGGNVTYKPGSRMVKINSDPKTYAVDERGTLRWVMSESAAVALYGSSWNTMIDDVPDAFFSNYDMGADIEAVGDFDKAAAAAASDSINEDKELEPAVVITINDGSYDESTYEIEAGRAVKFVNAGAMKHTATADDDSWGTGTLAAGQSFSRYFKEEGEWDFHCNYHDSMTATIVVE
jgi:plastocyanin